MQAVRLDGVGEEIKQFNASIMEQILERPDISHVRVFKLKRGMVVEVEGQKYVVESVSKKGAVHMKPVEEKEIR